MHSVVQLYNALVSDIGRHDVRAAEWEVEVGVSVARRVIYVLG